MSYSRLFCMGYVCIIPFILYKGFVRCFFQENPHNMIFGTMHYYLKHDSSKLRIFIWYLTQTLIGKLLLLESFASYPTFRKT